MDDSVRVGWSNIQEGKREEKTFSRKLDLSSNLQNEWERQGQGGDGIIYV